MFCVMPGVSFMQVWECTDVCSNFGSLTRTCSSTCVSVTKKDSMSKGEEGEEGGEELKRRGEGPERMGGAREEGRS